MIILLYTRLRSYLFSEGSKPSSKMLNEGSNISAQALLSIILKPKIAMTISVPTSCMASALPQMRPSPAYSLLLTTPELKVFLN